MVFTLAPEIETMKTKHKHEIRAYILSLLTENPEVRWQISELAEDSGFDSFEAMEFFENEVSRIEKLFCYPGLHLEEVA